MHAILLAHTFLEFVVLCSYTLAYNFVITQGALNIVTALFDSTMYFPLVSLALATKAYGQHTLTDIINRPPQPLILRLESLSFLNVVYPLIIMYASDYN